MIEIVDAYTRSGNELCTCCQKQTDTKRIKFSYDGRQGNSVVLCDDCRRELAHTIQAIPLDKIKKAREEISKQFVDLQDGSEEWRSYVNETVLECVEILDKLIAESEGEMIVLDFIICFALKHIPMPWEIEKKLIRLLVYKIRK